MKRFEEKIAIVTGGAQGLGKAIAARLVKEGAKVVIADNDETPLKATCAELGDIVTGIVTDVCQKPQVEAMVAATMQKYGRIDLLFSNAGVCLHNPFLDETVENWDTSFNANIRSMFLTGQAVAREMVKQGIHGAIVNTGSIACDLVLPATAAYAASKGAVMQLTKVMALELSKHGIRVNAFAPGAMLTRMTDHVRANPDLEALLMSKLVDKRYGEPEEAAAVALFLASDEASFVNGATYYVDGGYRVQ